MNSLKALMTGRRTGIGKVVSLLLAISLVMPSLTWSTGAMQAQAAGGGTLSQLSFEDNLTDLSGNSIASVGVTDADYVTGVQGKALQFSGDGSRKVSVESHLPLTGGNFTIEGWVYISEYTRSGLFVRGFSWGDKTGDIVVLMEADGHVKPHYYVAPTDARQFVSDEPLPLNEWTHVALVKDNGSMRLYLNGEENGSLAVPDVDDSANTNVLALGYYPNDSYLNLNGRIDEFKVSNAVRPTSGVTVNQPTLTLDSGDSQTILATVQPPSAANRQVAWNTSNPSVATVSSTGEVTGVSAGTAAITATTQDGGYTATTVVTVERAGPGLEGGTLSYFDFENNVVDAAGNTVHQLDIGADSYASGREGQALSLDGTGQQVAITSQLSLTGGEFTIEGWVYANEYKRSGLFVRGLSYGDKTGDVAVIMEASGKLKPHYYVTGSSPVQFVANHPLRLNEWTHVAIVKEDGLMKLYLNGTLDNSIAVPDADDSANSNPFAIGYYPNDDYLYFNGMIDEFRISDEARRPADYLPGFPVAWLEVNKDTLDLNIGGVAALQASIQPYYATNKTILWSSGNAAVATVDPHGTVTGVAEGTAQIVAITEEGEFRQTVNVTVSLANPEAGPVADDRTISLLHMNGDTVDAKGRSVQASGIDASSFVTGKYGSALQLNGVSSERLALDAPLSLTGGDFTIEGWVKVQEYKRAGLFVRGLSYGDKPGDIALIMEENGKLHPHYYGDNTAASHFYSIRTMPLDEWVHVALIKQGERLTLYWNGIADSSLQVKDVDDGANTNPLGIGHYPNDGNLNFKGVIDEFHVSSMARPVSSYFYYPVEGLSFEREKFVIGLGKTGGLKAIFEPAYASNQQLIWSSDNEAVASINEAGIISGLSNGKATIMAQSVEGDFTATAEVEVLELFNVIDKYETLVAQEGKTLYNEDKLDWFIDNIPFLDTPDGNINEVYYYRWRLYENTIRVNGQGKYEVTEGSPGESYHALINAPTAHHIYEGRWLADRIYMNDYIEVMENYPFPGYPNWLADAAYSKYLVDGDQAYITKQLGWLKDKFYERLQNETYTHYGHTGGYDSDKGLFYWISDREGMEATVSGFDELELGYTYTASLNGDGGMLDAVHDNIISYNEDPVNRWSSAGSSTATDWLEIDLGASMKLASVRVWFYENGADIKLPQSYQIQYWNGTGWADAVNQSTLPAEPAAGTMNVARFDEISTTKVRIVLTHQPGAASAITEWVPATYESGEVWNTVIFGIPAYRPSLNSYMYGNASAIARIAELAGDAEAQQLYEERAEKLRQLILDELWDEESEFFTQRKQSDYSPINARELVGFVPWYFNLPPDSDKYSQSWLQAMDEEGFNSTFGLTTLEARNPHFIQEFNHCCLWNGNVWPFGASQGLTAMANLLNNYDQPYVNAEDYYELLKKYTMTQYDSDDYSVLMSRENHHPYEKRWLAQARNYHHSTYNDMIISGLIGLRPRSDNMLEINPLIPAEWDYFALEDVTYHDKKVSIIFDRDGSHYNKGVGLSVWIDGRLAKSSPEAARLLFDMDAVESNDIIGFKPISDITVKQGSELSALLAKLPVSVTAIYEDASEKDLAVVWDTSTLALSAAGDSVL